MARIGIFGGSFDPPHIGHVALACCAIRELPLDELWVVPAGMPVHRRLSGRATAEVRLNWLRRIFTGVIGDMPRAGPEIRVVNWETGRAVPTIETLRRINREYPDMSPLLLLGSDAFSDIGSWVDYPEHRLLCDVAVFKRAGCEPAADQGWQPVGIDEWAARDGRGRMLRPHGDLPDVSATKVRDMAARGESLAGLVPDCVRSEIELAYGPMAEINNGSNM